MWSDIAYKDYPHVEKQSRHDNMMIFGTLLSDHIGNEKAIALSLL